MHQQKSLCPLLLESLEVIDERIVRNNQFLMAPLLLYEGGYSFEKTSSTALEKVYRLGVAVGAVIIVGFVCTEK